jgi:hypothetical protein
MFLGVPAYGDSGVVSFAFSANKLGRHTLNVELATNDATLVSRILETVSKKLGGPGDGGGPAAPAFADVVIARIQLTVTCIVKAIAVGR